MAADGTPELAAIRCGEAIARIRTSRGWSRAQLLLRLFNELPTSDPTYLSLSETWLARLENGRMVKIPRQTVEALCRALHCSPAERAHVLLWADRNVLAHCADDEPDLAAEVLTSVMDQIYREARDVLGSLVRQRAFQSENGMLDEIDECGVVAAVLDSLIARKAGSDALATGTTHAAQERRQLPQPVH